MADAVVTETGSVILTAVAGHVQVGVLFTCKYFDTF